eukprot:12877_1
MKFSVSTGAFDGHAIALLRMRVVTAVWCIRRTATATQEETVAGAIATAIRALPTGSIVSSDPTAYFTSKFVKREPSSAIRLSLGRSGLLEILLEDYKVVGLVIEINAIVLAEEAHELGWSVVPELRIQTFLPHLLEELLADSAALDRLMHIEIEHAKRVDFVHLARCIIADKKVLAANLYHAVDGAVRSMDVNALVSVHHFAHRRLSPPPAPVLGELRWNSTLMATTTASCLIVRSIACCPRKSQCLSQTHLDGCNLATKLCSTSLMISGSV